MQKIADSLPLALLCRMTFQFDCTRKYSSMCPNTSSAFTAASRVSMSHLMRANCVVGRFITGRCQCFEHVRCAQPYINYVIRVRAGAHTNTHKRTRVTIVSAANGPMRLYTLHVLRNRFILFGWMCSSSFNSFRARLHTSNEFGLSPSAIARHEHSGPAHFSFCVICILLSFFVF